MKIAAISGSLKRHSPNTAVLREMARMAPPDLEIVIYEGLGALPHFNPDLDTDPAPAPVQAFRQLLQDADAVIICTPEYAFNMPGVLKNALDWSVSSGELVEKPVAAISASPSYSGGDKALLSLLNTLTALSCNTPKELQFPIPAILKKLNDQNELSDEETKDKLRMMLTVLQELAKRS